MRLPPAAAVHLLPFSDDVRCNSRWLTFLAAAASFFCALSTFAEPVAPRVNYAQDSTANKAYIAEIELHTAAELYDILKRADQLFSEAGFAEDSRPVQFILHGDEAKVLQQSQYQQNKGLVDLAAQLSAFKVVDIRVCETWMQGQNIDAKTLPPFVGTVANGPKEKQRLMHKQGFVYF